MELLPLLQDDSFDWTSELLFYFIIVGLLSLLTYGGLRLGQRRLSRTTYWPKDFNLVSRVFWSVQLLLIGMGLWLLLPLLDVPRDWLIPLRLTARITVIISVAVLSMKAVSLVIGIFHRRFSIATANNLRNRQIRTQLQFIEKVVDIFILVITISLILISFEGFRRFGGSLLASAGLASVILGFAAQKSLANLIAGFQIAFTQPIRLDDAVVVEGEWGWVEEITLTYVVVRLWDLRRLVLPITYFVERPFQNWTRSTASLVGAIHLHVDHRTPVDDLRTEFGQILRSTDLWDGETEVLQVTDAGPRTMEIRCLASARNSAEAWNLRCYVREKLLAFLRDQHPNCLPLTRLEWRQGPQGLQ